MSTQSDSFHSQNAKKWQATKKKGRLRYALIYGSLWGSFMIFVKLLDAGIGAGLAAISWQLIYDSWIMIPLGMLAFYTFFWWANTKYYSRKKSKNIV